MNLVSFLKCVNEKCNSLSDEELRRFVYEVARTFPEDGREEFLRKLDLVKGEVTFHDDEDLENQIQEVRNLLKSIDDGDKELDLQFIPDYRYWEDEDEVYYEDPDGLLDDIEKATELVHRLVDHQKYNDAYDVGKTIAKLKVYAYGDDDGDELSISDLHEKDLLGNSYKGFIDEYLYVSYLCNDMAQRPSVIYEIMEEFGYADLSLESILQAGDKQVPAFDEFIRKWVDFLGEKDEGRKADKLLAQAFDMLQEDEDKLFYCQAFQKIHPELYLQLFKQIDDKDKIIDIGLKALSQIPADLVARSDIALYIGKIANECGRADVCEKAYKEAFISDTSAVSFLRLVLLCDADREELHCIYEDVYRRKKTENDYQRKKNTLTEIEYYLICFFDGRFDEVMDKAMSGKGSLGWSFTFMKMGLALFLALLNEDLMLNKRTRRLFHLAVEVSSFVSSFYEGISDLPDENVEQLFYELFMKWKKDIRIDENKADRWIKKIGRLIQNRCEAILRGSHRSYYGECAAYVTAYGEMLESRGVGSYRETIMSYRKTYPRHSAFHRELNVIE